MERKRNAGGMMLNDLTVGYVPGESLLTHLNLSLEEGELVALIGRNGSGKSTLLRTMMGLLDPFSGNVLMEGRPVPEFSLRERAKRISFVSSGLAQIPSMRVYELVSLGRMPYTGWTGKLESTDRQEVERSLQEVGMQGLQSRKLEQLSDGERQRALIARALAQDTPTILLDEPTAFLDIPNRYELIRILTRLRDLGRSVVYSTHDIEVALMCADKLWIIHQGSVREGAPEDLGLSGILETVFLSAGIRFEENSMMFRYRMAERGTIRIEGEKGKASIWTTHALSRLGFRIVPRSETSIRITGTGNDCQWEFRGNDSTETFSTLYSLCRFLTEAD